MPAHVLLSGATGYIAAHTVAGLLDAGYRVKGTVRNPDDAQGLAYLTSLPGADERLTLVAADLTDDQPFDEHVKDVDLVIHMASPYAVNVRDPRRDLLEPAVRGTESMLRACAAAPGVRRVVLTSSIAAVTDEPPARVLTEDDWNTSSSLDRNPYYFSKAEAERAAWRFVEDHKPAWDLVSINPFIVIGPSLNKRLNESPKIIADLLNGQFPAIMALTWGFVDVRDVAAAHINALTADAAHGRYLCAADTRPMSDVVTLLRSAGFTNSKLPRLSLTSPLGVALGKLLARTQPRGVASYLLTHLGRVPRFDNSKIRRDLDIEFRDVDQSLVETAHDLARWGHVKPPA